MPLLFSTAHGTSSFEPTTTTTTTKINRKPSTSRYLTPSSSSSTTINNNKTQRLPLQINNNLLTNCQMYSAHNSISISNNKIQQQQQQQLQQKIKRSSSLRSVTPPHIHHHQQQQQQQQSQQTQQNNSVTRNKSISIVQKYKSKPLQVESTSPTSTTTTTMITPNNNTFTTIENTINNQQESSTLLLSMAPLSTANLTTQNQLQLIDISSAIINISQYNNIENCNCFLCESILNDKRNSMIYNYELTPINDDYQSNDRNYTKYSYGKPYSQLSSMKLFNLMNTDCTIYYNNESTNNDETSSSSDDTTIITDDKCYLHVHNNKPPIYDTRYLYIIDCRLDRKKYEQSHINTSIHYTDLLNDDIYLSPPLDHYTIIVLYDDDGTYLTSSSSTSINQQKRLPHTNKKLIEKQESSDLLITKIKEKLNSYNGVIYLLSGGYDQFSFTYPFMCSNLEIRSTVDRYKHLIIYPNCVLENQIFIGTGVQAKNWKIIRDLNITHIINCSIEHECIFSDAIKYLHCKLEDTLDENIYRELERAYRFIENAFNSSTNDNNNNNNNDLNNGSESDDGDNNNSCSNGSQTSPVRILIHCNLGISRSSSILIAYLIKKYKLCLYSTFNYVKDKRNQIAPNYSFLKQLKFYEDKNGH